MKTKNYLFSALLILGTCIIFTSSCGKDDSDEDSTPETGTVVDIDGNVYKTVKIGDQVWMAENLKTTKYRNGDAIPEVTGNTAWGALTTGAYCNYDNNAANVTTYGRLYNWFAVNDSRNIAPAGWHVATDVEWTTLTTYLGGENLAGGKLKETGTAHWKSSNDGVTNETGFTALPGGHREVMESFHSIGYNGSWWSNTEASATYAYYRYVACYYVSVGRDDGRKGLGFSVRCLRD